MEIRSEVTAMGFFILVGLAKTGQTIPIYG
jgi:hypothetical protein